MQCRKKNILFPLCEKNLLSEEYVSRSIIICSQTPGRPACCSATPNKCRSLELWIKMRSQRTFPVGYSPVLRPVWLRSSFFLLVIFYCVILRLSAAPVKRPKPTKHWYINYWLCGLCSLFLGAMGLHTNLKTLTNPILSHTFTATNMFLLEKNPSGYTS